jgi:DNA-binding response OmpR family regulator
VTTDSAQSPVIRYGDLKVDKERYLVTFAGQVVALTYMEYRLLVRIAEAMGRVVSYEDLALACWGDVSSVDRRRLAVLISRIRTKMGPGSDYLSTVQRVGYRLVPLEPRSAA